MAPKAGLLAVARSKLAVALLLALLGSRARPKNTAFLTIISKTGRFVVCFMKAQKKEKEVCWAAVVRPPPILFSVGCIGRMVRPVKGFQHRGMIPVLGPRAARRARKHTGGPGFDPRFGPRLFFCPLSLHYPKDPPMRPRSRAVPVSSISRGREADEAAVGTRDPQRSFADKTTEKKRARGTTGADTQPQICRISITRRLGRRQIEPGGTGYPSRT